MKNSYPHTLRPPSHAALFSRKSQRQFVSFLSQAAAEAGRFAFLKG